tara:strand:- start:342 stop:674 length:333 start_codon:yes stop_codon:yes gene_type:complete
MAIRSNLFIDQGADHEFTFNVTDDDDLPIDLTGYTGAAQFRKHYSSSNSTAFTVELDANNGIVTLKLDAATSANTPYGRYVYDCKITSGANLTTRIVEGIVTVRPQATRP